MTTNRLACAVAILAGSCVPAIAQETLANDTGMNTQQTYAGEITFQNQTITGETADFLHCRLLEQRATQLPAGRFQ